MHFLVAGLAIIKSIARIPELAVLWPLAVLYVGFAAAFGAILFRHPIGAEPKRAG